MSSQNNAVNEEPIGRCEKCAEQYIDRDTANIKWCKLCQINYFKRNFTNWTSGNEKIDNVKEMQLKIDKYNDILFEWIPYNQFSDIKEISRGGFSTVYSAIWKDGLLEWNYDDKYTRSSNFKVALKCLHNSQNITNEFLNEV